MTDKGSKAKQIAESVSKGASLQELREFCISEFGLVDQLRRIEVWPLLLDAQSAPTEILESVNSYSEQIEKDCDRSLHQIDITSQMSDEAKLLKQRQLSRILNSIINYDPSLHYYQGLNDIAGTFLLVAGESLGHKLAVQASHRFLKDCMRANFDLGTKAELKLVYSLLALADPELSCYIEELCPELPLFCVSWLLTWFSHDLYSFENICRIFDFVLASHSLSPVYLTVQILLHYKDQILRIDELGKLHKFVGKNLEELPWENVIQQAHRLMVKFPPEDLGSMASPRFLPDSPHLTRIKSSWKWQWIAGSLALVAAIWIYKNNRLE